MYIQPPKASHSPSPYHIGGDYFDPGSISSPVDQKQPLSCDMVVCSSSGRDATDVQALRIDVTIGATNVTRAQLAIDDRLKTPQSLNQGPHDPTFVAKHKSGQTHAFNSSRHRSGGGGRSGQLRRRSKQDVSSNEPAAAPSTATSTPKKQGQPPGKCGICFSEQHHTDRCPHRTCSVCGGKGNGPHVCPYSMGDIFQEQR